MNIEIIIQELRKHFNVTGIDSQYNINDSKIYGIIVLKSKLSKSSNVEIWIDNVRCFDKLSTCPLQLPLPKSIEELDYLIKQIHFWGTDAGYEISNSYDWDKYITEYK